ncbi:MAG: hypothetical protein WDM89_01550 [Rhizomicrobium sp.]
MNRLTFNRPRERPARRFIGPAGASGHLRFLQNTHNPDTGRNWSMRGKGQFHEGVSREIIEGFGEVGLQEQGLRVLV